MSSIEALFPSQTIVKVLSLFLLNPDKEYFQSEVAEVVGDALFKVQKALKRAVKSGFILETKKGNMVYYRANRKQPGFEDLKQLFLKTVAIGDALKEVLTEYAGDIDVAFIFGSYAQGTETYQSDIDLFVLGNTSLKKVSEAIGSMTNMIDREINPVVYSAEAFKKKIIEKNRFTEELVACPKIWLIGNEDEFRSLAK